MPTIVEILVEILLSIRDALQDDPSYDYVPDLVSLNLTCRGMHYKLGDLVAADAEFYRRQTANRTLNSIHRASGPTCRKPSLLWYIENSDGTEKLTECIGTWKYALPESIVLGVTVYENKETPGHAAIRSGRLDVLQPLAREGFPVTGGKTGRTWRLCNNLLMAAIEERQSDIALWLLDRGVTFDKNELEAAVSLDLLRVVEVLLRKGTAGTNTGSRTLLGAGDLKDALLAASGHSRRRLGPFIDGRLEIIDLLVEAGASLSNTGDHTYQRPLFFAAQRGCYGNALRIFEHQLRQDTVHAEDLWSIVRIAARSDEALELIKAIHPRYTHLMYESGTDRDAPLEVFLDEAHQHLKKAHDALPKSSRILQYLTTLP
ncbi:hypothetical protein DL769_004724 [Monosporascus sp. CRB-8-3]|nr:hypothetical protein DL769_004724 [Monosporascus sp. CRB-8-3]